MKVLLSFVAAAVLMVSIVRAAEFHVAIGGTQAGPGDAAHPFASLPDAQKAARRLAGREPVHVLVHEGTYYLTAPWTFEPEDSGSAQAPIVYEAAPGETVVLSGGRRLVLDWRPYRDGIQQASVPPEVGAVDQLFINGQRQRMARYPNYNPTVRPYNGYAADAFAPARAARWANPAGGFIHAMHVAHWGGYHYRITGKDAAGNVTYEGGWQNNRQMGMHPEFRFVENVFEELDAPGEWFYHPGQGVLYHFPSDGVDLGQALVEVVRLRHLVEFQGRAANPAALPSGKGAVRHVTLRGFVFRHAARTFMDVKEPLLRSDWTIYRGGAVLFSGAEDCTVAECVFDQVGGNAVFVNRYNRRVTLLGCDFRETGASAVAFVGDPGAVRSPLFEYQQRQSYGSIDRTPGPRGENYPADCLVDDCLIRGVGLVEKQATGVEISMSARITVRHCSIYDASRAGINVSEGTFGGHVIEFCDVFDTVRETGDHGSFNSWGRDRFWELKDTPAGEAAALARLDMVGPNILRNNRWRCDHGWDVDLDDGSSNYEIHHNLFLNGGLKLREGFHRRVWNNIAVNNSLHPHVWFEECDDVVTNNIWMGPYQPAAMSGSLKKWGREVDRNLFATTDADRLRFAEKGCDLNSRVGDPRFVDPANGDYRVREGSPALAMGFENFPMDQFGVQKASLRAVARTPVLPRLAGSRRGQDGTDVAETPLSWLGMTLRGLVGEEYSALGVSKETGGVLVVEAPTGTPAARSGLQKGDLVVTVNGAAVRRAEELLRRVHALAGQNVELTVVRAQQKLVLKVRE